LRLSTPLKQLAPNSNQQDYELPWSLVFVVASLAVLPIVLVKCSVRQASSVVRHCAVHVCTTWGYTYISVRPSLASITSTLLAKKWNSRERSGEATAAGAVRGAARAAITGGGRPESTSSAARRQAASTPCSQWDGGEPRDGGYAGETQVARQAMCVQVLQSNHRALMHTGANRLSSLCSLAFGGFDG
jgi:hypothetical protein